MTRPTPSTGITAGDALNASNVGANDQPDSDDDEQNAFGVEPKRARRGPGGSGHANNGARGVATSPLGDKERATPGSAGGRGSIDTYYKRVDGVPPAPAFGTSPTHGVGGINPRVGLGRKEGDYPRDRCPPKRGTRGPPVTTTTPARSTSGPPRSSRPKPAPSARPTRRGSARRGSRRTSPRLRRGARLAAELEASRERASAEAARHQRDQNKTAGVIALAVKVARFEANPVAAQAGRGRPQARHRVGAEVGHRAAGGLGGRRRLSRSQLPRRRGSDRQGRRGRRA